MLRLQGGVQYQQLRNDTGGSPTGWISRRRDCHLMAPPCNFIRCFNRDKQGVSSKSQSRRRLGWMDFVSCCLEAAATPLLDLQSDPTIQGYWPGLEQIVIRDCASIASTLPCGTLLKDSVEATLLETYCKFIECMVMTDCRPPCQIKSDMNADALAPHFGAKGRPPLVAINCSLNSIPDQKTEPGAPSGCSFDGLYIESGARQFFNRLPPVELSAIPKCCQLSSSSGTAAGFPPESPAVRVYAGSIIGTTIIAAASGVYSELGVKDAHGLPTGEWKQSNGAGWLMSGGDTTPALTFLPSGAKAPTRMIYADGTEKHVRVFFFPQMHLLTGRAKFSLITV